MFGDEQGSAQVMMQVTLDASGAMLAAEVTDLITCNAYTPYGAVRGADNLTIDHGWLNQVSDEASTGLVYLNARYYDSGTSRFVSPDPLMDPSDPKTLDAFRYADNNPATYTDATGMVPNCPSYLSASQMAACQGYANSAVNYMTGEPTVGQPTPGTTTVVSSTGSYVVEPPLSTELVDFTNGDDDACYPWAPCGSYTGMGETVTWDPNDRLTYQEVNEAISANGTSSTWFWKVFFNQIHPDNLAMEALALILAGLSGASCRGNAENGLLVCTGAGLGYVPTAGGTTVGSVYVTKKSPEEIERLLVVEGRDEVGHEGEHSDRAAVQGVLMMGLQIGLEEAANWFHRMFLPGGDTPKGCNSIEREAGYYNGGYDQCTG